MNVIPWSQWHQSPVQYFCHKMHRKAEKTEIVENCGPDLKIPRARQIKQTLKTKKTASALATREKQQL